jgi:DNA-binding PucR family transcriptional regulator
MRQGLAGARQSLDDADAAARAAQALDAPLVMFRTDWLACLALKHTRQLSVLVAPAVQALENDPDLCTTLETFLGADGSLANAGKALFVHANTVAYRLRQFAVRTGIDPRTATGMALTQLALTYSRTAAHAAAAPDDPRWERR